MVKREIDIQVESPTNQTKLFGYSHYFSFFSKLLKNAQLPHAILLSGPKGIGKATFTYHFVNYLLSLNEEKKYSVENYEINLDNKSYILLSNNVHPNLYILDSKPNEQNIKIEQVRHLLKFLSKSTYSNNKKIVIIDNSEYLNLNSGNAILKALEEPDSNTFFFLIHNKSENILNTIKSRCIKFDFSFTPVEKKEILKNIIKSYKIEFDLDNLPDSFYYDTPGNILKYLLIFNDSKLNISDDKLSCIFLLIEKYKNKKDPNILAFISFFVEQFYNELVLLNKSNINLYFINKFKILKQIYLMKKFNLEQKSSMLSIKSILENER